MKGVISRGPILFLVMLVFLLMLCSCDREDVINFDLSEYKDHGNLSCGLIWVTKTESSWDSVPQDYFAYFDANGNLKSHWFSCDEYQPEDFQNDYLVLRGVHRAFEDNGDYYKCKVYNKSFIEISSLYCRRPVMSPCYISNFNAQGYSFAIAYDEDQKEDALYWIDAQGEHIFQDPNSNEAYSISIDILNEYTLQKIKYANGYFVIVDGSSDTNYLYTKIAQIYDKNGRFVLDLEYQMQKHTEECAITSAEILGNSIAEFRFYGMDENKYVCVMDFDGNIVKEPVLASEYKRDDSLIQTSHSTQISHSERLVTVPMVTAGESEDLVSARLSMLGFKVLKTYEINEEVDAGKVVGLNPEPGTPLSYGSEVLMLVSVGTSFD